MCHSSGVPQPRGWWIRLLLQSPASSAMASMGSCGALHPACPRHSLLRAPSKRSIGTLPLHPALPPMLRDVPLGAGGETYPLFSFNKK